MKSEAITKQSALGLAKPYQAALRRYIKTGTAASLRPALKLGRQAVADGLETLDLALIHEQALLALLPPAGHAGSLDEIVNRSGTFFAEAILPIEKTHAAAVQTNAKLIRLNEALKLRSRNLASSNQQLKKEVARRLVTEQSLRESEQQTVRLLEQSRQLQEQMRLLSRRALSAQEEERKRISRDLHDVIAQTLTGINVRLAALKMEATANSKGLSRQIASTQRMVEKSVAIVHQFARELRPAMLDDLGLIPTLQSLLKQFTRETGVRASMTAFAGVEELSRDRRTTLYRVAQEALTNVSRHASASQVQVDIRKRSNAIDMQIKDDGQSFDVERALRAGKKTSLGLIGMKERVEMVGGSFSIESSPGNGTTIKARIPFRDGSEESP